MKIAIVTDAIYPYTIGGSEIRNYEVAKRLVKNNHQVHILGAKLWEGNPEIEMEGIKIFGLQKYQRLYTKKGKRSIFPPIFLAFKIFSKLLKEDYDIIDVTAFTFLNCYTAKLASLIKKTFFILTWQQYFGDYLTGYFGKVLGITAQILEFFSTKLTKNNVAVSGFVKSELIKAGVKDKNIKIIYNGADGEQIKNSPVQEKIYDLIFVGRLNYQKNLPLLVKAVKLLKKDFPNIKTAIVGKGEEKEKLENLIKEYNLLENFIFLGEIKEKEKLYKYLKCAKIFVLPSVLEGFPLTIIEANSAGLPVVSTKTNHNNTQEYIINNENGLIANAEPEDFSDKISVLLKNSTLLEKMSKIGIQKAEAFSWDKIAKTQEEYYKSLLIKSL